MSQAPGPSEFVLHCWDAIKLMDENERKGAWISSSEMTVVFFPRDYENSNTPDRVLEYALALNRIFKKALDKELEKAKKIERKE